MKYAIVVIIEGQAENEYRAKENLKRRLMEVAGFKEKDIDVIDCWLEQ